AGFNQALTEAFEGRLGAVLESSAKARIPLRQRHARNYWCEGVVLAGDATRMEAIGKRMRETNAVADAWVQRLGDKPTGQVGNLLIQMTRSMAFDLALAAQDQVNEDGEEEPVSLGMLKDLALTIQRLEKASMDSLNRE